LLSPSPNLFLCSTGGVLARIGSPLHPIFLSEDSGSVCFFFIPPSPYGPCSFLDYVDLRFFEVGIPECVLLSPRKHDSSHSQACLLLSVKTDSFPSLGREILVGYAFFSFF